MVPVAAEATLQKTADYIIEHGWCQGGNGRAGQKVCVAVALSEVAKGQYYRNWMEATEELTRRANALGFGCTCGGGECPDANAIIDFNDHAGRTQDEVLTFLSDKWETLKAG